MFLGNSSGLIRYQNVAVVVGLGIQLSKPCLAPYQWSVKSVPYSSNFIGSLVFCQYGQQHLPIKKGTELLEKKSNCKYCYVLLVHKEQSKRQGINLQYFPKKLIASQPSNVITKPIEYSYTFNH